MFCFCCSLHVAPNKVISLACACMLPHRRGALGEAVEPPRGIFFIATILHVFIALGIL